MTEIALKLLQNLAIAERDRQVRSMFLDGTDEAILEKAAKPHVPNKSWNFSLWGSLAPENAISSFANSTIIIWALRTLGGYCSVADVASVLQTKFVYVDSALISHELDRFEVDKDYKPTDKFMKRANLFHLRERMQRCTAKTLDEIPGVEIVAIPLNSKNAHWSLVIYSCKDKSVAHYDSIDGMHEDLAKKTYRLLAALNFIPHGAPYLRRSSPAQQSGGWECGFALIATALFLSDALEKIYPAVKDPKEVIENADKLRYLITYMLQRSREAREIDAFFSQRLDKIYTDE
jgi:hypothetical protein